MKEKGGHFKQKSEFQIIGQSNNEPDVADLMKNMEANDQGEGSQDEEGEEDNEDGMDVEIEEDKVAEGFSDDEEEKKQWVVLAF